MINHRAQKHQSMHDRQNSCLEISKALLMPHGSFHSFPFSAVLQMCRAGRVLPDHLDSLWSFPEKRKKKPQCVKLAIQTHKIYSKPIATI